MVLRSNGLSHLRASSAAVLVPEKLARGIRNKVASVISQQHKRGKRVTTGLMAVQKSHSV